MAGELKLYYSSGSALTNEFGKDPSESIGGIITSVEVVGGLNNLFRSISQKAISEGSTEYRIIFLKNIGADTLTTLEFYKKVPATTVEIDPSAIGGLSDGDEYIVTEGATGDWDGQDGKKATYVLATTSWTFDFASFATFEFGFISPVDIELDDVTLTASYVDPLETVFEPPFGVTFVEADDVDGSTKVGIGDGSYVADEILAMVIKRSVTATTFDNDLFTCPDDDEFAPNTTIQDEQIETIIFSYDDGV